MAWSENIDAGAGRDENIVYVAMCIIYTCMPSNRSLGYNDTVVTKYHFIVAAMKVCCSADLNVVLGFINTMYEASETDMAVTIQIGLLNGSRSFSNEVSLELTVSNLSMSIIMAVRYVSFQSCKLLHACIAIDNLMDELSFR
jgi:hypothetical protein